MLSLKINWLCQFYRSVIADFPYPVFFMKGEEMETISIFDKLERLKAENEDLKRLIAEKDKTIEELKTTPKNTYFCLDRTRYDITSEKILELKNGGLSNYKIAKILNCSEGTIRNRVKNMD